MRGILAAALAVAASACAKEIVDPRSSEVDFADPKSVTASIFHAAATGEYAHLASLCDPAGENDEDTARICKLRPDSPDWPSFRDSFARAHLNGEPRISGDRAALHFVYGAEARDSETMELVRRDRRWYLLRF